MTLKRLMILLGILIFLAGVGIMWLWHYAYTPEGRARVIIAQLKGDTTSLRGWLLQHHLVRAGFTEPNQKGQDREHRQTEPDFYREEAATGVMVNLGHEVLPVLIEGLRDKNRYVRKMGIRTWVNSEIH